MINFGLWIVISIVLSILIYSSLYICMKAFDDNYNKTIKKYCLFFACMFFLIFVLIGESSSDIKPVRDSVEILDSCTISANGIITMTFEDKNIQPKEYSVDDIKFEESKDKKTELVFKKGFLGKVKEVAIKADAKTISQIRNTINNKVYIEFE